MHHIQRRKTRATDPHDTRPCLALKYASPKTLARKLCQLGIASHQHHLLQFGLRGQHAVKRVSVNSRVSTRAQRVRGCDVELGKPVKRRQLSKPLLHGW